MRFLLILIMLLSIAAPASADFERYNEGRRLALDGRKDFAMIEFEAFLRESVDEAKSREARFALTEYYFEVKNPMESRKHLETLPVREDAMGLLTTVYGLKVAEANLNAAEAARLTEKLKTDLASKKMLVFFKKKRDQKWTSPLGNRYQFIESVDRMEILRNGSPFHEVTLP